MSQIEQIRMNKIYRLTEFCLQLADIADQKQETPFNDVLHTRYGAFSAYMRQGVKEIIDLKQDYYQALFRKSLAESSEDDARDFIEISDIRHAQTAVELVRCKDCKFRENDDFCTGRGFPYQLVPDDGFCDKGKRKG